MDSDVLDVLQELGCFSAAAGSIDDVADNPTHAIETNPIDDPWFDIGGEG